MNTSVRLKWAFGLVTATALALVCWRMLTVKAPLRLTPRAIRTQPELLVQYCNARTPPIPAPVHWDSMEEQLLERMLDAISDLGSRPDSARRWGALGMLYHVHELAPQGKACYQQAMELDRQDETWPYLLALLEMETGQFEASKRALEETLRRRPEMPAANWRLGSVALNMGDLDAAHQAYQRYLDHHPDSAAAHVAMAKVDRARGHLKDAERRLRRAIDLEPELGLAHHQLGQTLQAIGRQEEADAALRRADRLGRAPLTIHDVTLRHLIKLRAGGSVGLAQQMEQAAERGQWEDLAAICKQITETETDDFVAWAYRGHALLQLQRPDEALAAARQAILINPHYPASYCVTARIHLGREDFSAALATTRNARAQGLHDSSILHCQGEALAGLNRLDEALASLRQAAALAPTEKAILQTLTSTLQRAVASNHAAKKRDQQRELLGIMHRRTALEPERIDLLLQVAGTAHALEQFEITADACTKILLLEPKHRIALNNLAWTRGIELGHLTESLELANVALTFYPDDPELLSTRGSILAGMERTEEAIDDLSKGIRLSQQNRPTLEAMARFQLGSLLANTYHQASKTQAQAGQPAVALPQEALKHLRQALLLDQRQTALTQENRNRAKELIEKLAPLAAKATSQMVPSEDQE